MNRLHGFGAFVSIVLALTAISGCAPVRAQGPLDKTWISPGKTRISNLRPGSTAKQNVTIHNGRQTPATFSIYYRIPDYVETGFVTAPENAKAWVSVAEATITLEPQASREVEVAIMVPQNETAPARWEFWIGVREETGGSLISELRSRWLVTMKSN